jgi:RHS repeat-associated protein
MDEDTSFDTTLCEDVIFCNESLHWFYKILLNGQPVDSLSTGAGTYTTLDISFVPTRSGKYQIKAMAADRAFLNSGELEDLDPNASGCSDPGPSAYGTKDFTVYEPVIEVDQSPERADRRKSFDPRLFRVPPNAIVRWSLLGNPRGATIDPITGKLTFARYKVIGGQLHRQGIFGMWFRVRAKITVPGNPAPGSGNCADCEQNYDTVVEDSDCDEGKGEHCESGACTTKTKVKASLTSVNVALPMGMTADGKSAGNIIIYSDSVRPQLGNPSLLSFRAGADPEAAEVIRDAANGDTIRQVICPQVVADVRYNPAVNLDGYSVAFYKTSDLTQPVTPGALWEIPPISEVQPVSTWKLSYHLSTEGVPLFTVDDMQTVNGQPSFTRFYQYSQASDGHIYLDSIIQEGSVPIIKREAAKWTYDNGTPTSHEYRLYDANGVDIARTETESMGIDTITGGPKITTEIKDSGVVLEKEIVVLYPYSLEDGSAGQTRSIINTDGSWQAFKYDIEGRPTVVYSSWANEAFPTDPESNPNPHRMTLNDYSETEDDDRPLSVREYFYDTGISDYILTSSTKYAYDTIEGNRLRKTEKRYSTYDDSNHTGTYLETVTEFDDETEDKPRKITYPDGRVDTYTYQTGGYTDTGDPDDAAFDTHGSGGYECTTIVHGSTEHPNGVPYKSTKQVTVKDITRHTLLEETHACGGNGAFERIDWTVRRYVDDHLWEVHRSNGDRIDQQWDCCHIQNITDEDGVFKSFTYDSLGRVKTAIKHGVSADDDHAAQADITTTYEYDTFGNVKSTTVAGGSETAIHTSRTFDAAGRIKTEIDAAQLETGYSYGGLNSELTTTKTFPGGAQEVTRLYRDGRLDSITGSAVVGQYYKYGVEPDGTQWTRIETGTSDRYVKTWFDLLGRKIKEERPGWNSGTRTMSWAYNVKGQLWKITSNNLFREGESGGWGSSGDPGEPGEGDMRSEQGGANKLHYYDELGNLVRWGVDIDENDALVLASFDRIQDSESNYIVDSGAWWLATEDRVYPADGQASSVTTSLRKVQLTGLAAGVRSFMSTENVNRHTSTTSVEVDRTAKLVTETSDSPYSDTDEVLITRNGLLQSATTVQGITSTYGYDAFGRQTVVTDPRTGDATTHYEPGKHRIASVIDANQSRREYAYYSTTGRLSVVTSAIVDEVPMHTRYAYNERGQITNIWGNAAQPVTFGYDSFGQRTSMTTYNSTQSSDWDGDTWVAPNNSELTQWEYDDATGFLTKKTYASLGLGSTANVIRYEYTPGGALWKRNTMSGAISVHVGREYEYDPMTGDMLSITYNPDPSGTPDVSYTYDRLGRVKTVTDAVGERTISYESDYLYSASESIGGTSALYEKIISTQRTFTDSGSTKVLSQTLKAGTSGTPDQDYSVVYARDLVGRIHAITGTGLPPGGVDYTYYPDSNLVNSTAYLGAQGQIQGESVRVHENYRDLVTSIENSWIDDSQETLPNTTISRYDYRNDEAGRRTLVARQGAAYVDSTENLETYGYNSRSELTLAQSFEAWDFDEQSFSIEPVTDSVIDERRLAFSYDAIGNRTAMSLGWTNEAPDSTSSYVSNKRNQYSSTSSPSEGFDYDRDGNMLKDGTPTLYFNYSWDAENRLLSVTPKSPGGGSKLLKFAYDYLGRRVQKRVFTWDPTLDFGNGGWPESPDSDVRFVYDGWNVILELDGLNNNVVLKKYTWGLDVARRGMPMPTVDDTSISPQFAGGIGGLLSCYDTNGGSSTTSDDVTYSYLYDANGNVTQLINMSNHSIAAAYEYDVIGNMSYAAGPYAAANRLRFSTKYHDSEIDFGDPAINGLYYYGYRYYSPRLGRWMSRDPINELGGLNIHAFVRNRVVDRYDPFGLCCEEGEKKDEKCTARAHDYGSDPESKDRQDALIDALGSVENLVEFLAIVRLLQKAGKSLEEAAEEAAEQILGSASEDLDFEDIAKQLQEALSNARGNWGGWHLWTRMEYQECVCSSSFFGLIESCDWEKKNSDWNKYEKGGIDGSGRFTRKDGALSNASKACDEEIAKQDDGN